MRQYAFSPRLSRNSCVARPHLRAHRMTITIDQHRQNHLSQIRSMILAISVAAERLPARALEVQTGRIHEHQVEASEQVAPMREQTLLDYILEAARRERRSTVLLLCRQLLTKPGHRPIEMVQIERFDVGDGIVFTPAIRRPVRATHEQA